ncbi:MFS general substrate transporter [Venustampulla echinocandica]|uniref:MFS general substrate transporter n=1 Tax=Venustampulla echinocandica TaxID=2656787 RepID=A0A370U1J8_9HELO|nr:MFS general substrate transporter [Venustampulla echinocandica]RDL41651.1 MFS general substrate transporter [Venustampulla echinocandica]
MAISQPPDEEGLLQSSVSHNGSVPESSEKLPPSREPKSSPVTWMDLPNKSQLFILSLCRLSEPLSNTCLLPYIYFLIKSIIDSDDDSAPQKISRLSGLLVAAFPLAQFATSMLWGRASDFYGRKPTIVIGLLVSVIANAAFGFSRNIGALMFWRILAGIANGNVGVMRTMTAEIVKERKYQTRAFLILPLVFNSGMVAGLALGGCLADPVVNLPWLFGPEGIFNVSDNDGGVAWALKYPYALPALSNAFTLMGSLILAVFWMRETLPGMEDDKDLGIKIGELVNRYIRRIVFRQRSSGYTAVTLEDFPSSEEFPEVIVTKPPPSRPQPPRPAFRSIWTRDVLVTIVSFGLLPLHNSAFMHIFPVFLSTPFSPNKDWSVVSFTGGLGLQSPSVGLWLSCFGICGIFLQLFIYPRVQARLGTLGCFRISLFIFPLAYLFAPYLSLLPQDGIARWGGIAVILCAQVMARTIAIPSTVILLTNSAPSKTVLGTVHGAGNMLSSLARAVGSAAGGWVFAWGMERGMVGAVWWCYLLFVAVIALAWSYTMRDGVGEAPNSREDMIAVKEEVDLETPPRDPVLRRES